MTPYVAEEAAQIRAQRAALRVMEQALAERTQALIDGHLGDATIRQVAALVDLSPQRIAQLRPGHRARGQMGKSVPDAITVSEETAGGEMYGRAARSMTMHRLDQDGRPVCGNRRIADQAMVSQMPLSSAQKYSFLSICSRCAAKG